VNVFSYSEIYFKIHSLTANCLPARSGREVEILILFPKYVDHSTFSLQHSSRSIGLTCKEDITKAVTELLTSALHTHTLKEIL
jgi:hypothetical protein